MNLWDVDGYLYISFASEANHNDTLAIHQIFVHVITKI